MDRKQDTSLFKILGHPERYAILRRLMTYPESLTQLGHAFNQTPAHIRHHLLTLEKAGLVELAEARVVQGGPEKIYRATQKAMFIHHAVLPETPKGKTPIVIGSMDAGLAQLASHLQRQQNPNVLLPIPLSSLDGLIALRHGLCQVSTCHLIDPQSEDYNRSYIRHLFPGGSMALVLVYRREEGLIVRHKNPLGIQSLEDLSRPEVRFVNREPGSGVRQWLDKQLSHLGLPGEGISGYRQNVHSHRAVSYAVHTGNADVGIGVASAARIFGLDFIPLFEEPYELAVPLDVIHDEQYAPFFAALNSGEIRSAVHTLDGYAVPQNSGRVEVVQ